MCYPGAGGCGESSDHRILGAVVEHLASGREHRARGRAIDRRRVPVATLPHGGGLHGAVLHLAVAADANRNPGASHSHPDAKRGRLMLTEFLAMGGYAAFVWPAYGVTALGLSAAVLLTLRGYASAKARLAQFTGETGPPRRASSIWSRLPCSWGSAICCSPACARRLRTNSRRR